MEPTEKVKHDGPYDLPEDMEENLYGVVKGDVLKFVHALEERAAELEETVSRLKSAFQVLCGAITAIGGVVGLLVAHALWLALR